jgi:hypothetical protein
VERLGSAVWVNTLVFEGEGACRGRSVYSRFFQFPELALLHVSKGCSFGEAFPLAPLLLQELLGLRPRCRLRVETSVVSATGLLGLDAAFNCLVAVAVKLRRGDAEREKCCGRGSVWLSKNGGFGSEFSEKERGDDSLASGETAVVGEADVGDVAEVLLKGGAGEVCLSRFHPSQFTQ